MRVEAPALTDAEIAAIGRRVDRPVVLVGLMGVGKSTVGRKLAALIRKDFVDADEEIEHAAQRSVGEIFEEFGEEYFRDGERRVLARLIEDGHGVIATGGGAFVDDATRGLILAEAVAVWIDCDIRTLVQRTARRDTRPLLRDGDPEQILTRLRDRRQDYYAQAPIRVTSVNGPHHLTALAILEAIERWL